MTIVTHRRVRQSKGPHGLDLVSNVSVAHLAGPGWEFLVAVVLCQLIVD